MTLGVKSNKKITFILNTDVIFNLTRTFVRARIEQTFDFVKVSWKNNGITSVS